MTRILTIIALGLTAALAGCGDSYQVAKAKCHMKASNLEYPHNARYIRACLVAQGFSGRNISL